MKFIADLHIHSKYSRATAKNLDLENLYYAAQIKGIQVAGTGDFTYPAWIEEIENKLEPAEPGLFALKKELAGPIDKTVPRRCRNRVRFILQTEISNIYKKEGRVRKNHNLIYFPDLQSVKRFNSRLDAIGNITSDGRPILGLDAADLLEIMLETDDAGFFVPAHIWTPWFSMFGSKSGFDSIEECFGELKKYIFAVETGLSSDPPMNWRVKDLDHVRLISNSDAHSPGYLGRNASVFDTKLSFFHIRSALEKNDLQAYQGTLDMYPDQGKYHYDGHRKCNVCLNPSVTAEMGGICPECGGKLTKGVLYRVQELANRPEGYMPENRQGFKNIIPLADILAQIFQVGSKTKKVGTYYDKAIELLGPELEILTDRSVDQIRSAHIPLLAESVEKMRTGDVNIDPGFDGEFGKVNLFTQQEKEQLQGERYPLFAVPVKKKKKQSRVKEKKAEPKLKKKEKRPAPAKPAGLLEGLNNEQRRAVESEARAIIIQAGPGTGKTRTLTAKIADLVSRKGVDPGSILALTFTNKAARELTERIDTFLPVLSGPSENQGVLSATFHAFCLLILKQYNGFDASIADDTLRLSLIGRAMGGTPAAAKIRQMDLAISRCKQMLLDPSGDLEKIVPLPPAFSSVYLAYQALCLEQDVVDFEELIRLTVEMLEKDPVIRDRIQTRFQFVFVDEYQDLNYAQYVLTRQLARNSRLMVIGDPDQSIYGFRGSDNRYFKDFSTDFPGCEKIILRQNYRSVQTILDASFQMISRSEDNEEQTRIYSEDQTFRKLVIKETASERAEAVAIGKMIEELVGGTSFFSVDAGKAGSDMEREYSFSDFAVLYRTRKEAGAFVQIFEKHGIPFQTADQASWMKTASIRDLISLCRILAGKAGVPDLETAFAFLGAGSGKQVKQVLHQSQDRGRNTDLLAWLARDENRDIRNTKIDEKFKSVVRFLARLKEITTDLDPKDVISRLSKETGLIEKIEGDTRTEHAFSRMLAIAGFHEKLDSFLDEIALNRDVDTMAERAEKVSLMTMHSAKGLEFPVVFVAGCEQGLIPFARDGEQVEDPEEERRLFYVAMTRAMEILCLTYAKKRQIFGRLEKRQRSVFIGDIERKLTRFEKPAAPSPKPKKEIQLELF